MHAFLQTVSDLFNRVMTHSWQASLIVVLILITSWALKNKLSSRLRHALWWVLLLKLLLPMAPSSPVSLFNWFPSEVHVDLTLRKQSAHPVEPNQMPGIAATSGTLPAVIPRVQEPVDTTPVTREMRINDVGTPVASFSWMSLAGVIWALGCISFFLTMIVGNFRFVRQLKSANSGTSPDIQDLLRESAAQLGLSNVPGLIETSIVTTPAVHGWIKPNILLTTHLSDSLSRHDLRHVFLHELAHIKRRDLLVHWLAHMIRCVHWFNPVIWYAVARMRRDCEVATDALALHCLGEGHRQAYGETMLLLLKRVQVWRHLPGLVGMVDGKQEMKQRILSIRGFRDRARFSFMAAAGAVVLSMVSLTRALPNTEVTPEPEDSSSTSISDSTSEKNLIVCKVIDPEGNPVPDTVVAFGTKNKWFREIGRTNDRGVFEVPTSEIKPDLILHSKGWAPTMHAFDYDLTLLKRTYQLEAPKQMTGAVVDEEGKAVENAEVMPVDWYGFRGFNERLKTDDQGRVVWGSAPNHGEIEFSIFANGFKHVRDHLVSFQDELTIKLVKPDRVKGTVVDAQTGTFLPKFSVRVMDQSKIDGPLMNELHRVKGENGSFSVDLNEPANAYYVIEVSAEGYMTSQSAPFKDGGPSTPLLFELEKENKIQLEVVQPDGKAAGEADLVQLKKDLHEVWFSSPRKINLARIRDQSRISRTDANGHHALKPVLGMQGLVIAHENGYVELDERSLKSGDAITLKPWGKVEGQLFSGTTPLEGKDLRLSRNQFDGMLVVLQATTDRNGRFVFDGLPEGAYQLGRESGTILGWVDVRPGETATMYVGQEGRTLIGRAKVIEGDIAHLNWQREIQYIKTDLPLASDIIQPTEEEQRAGNEGIQRFFKRRDAFWHSEEGKALRRSERKYAVEFNDDGTFRIQGVIPGNYVLDLSLTDRIKLEPNRFSIITKASMHKKIQVPAWSEQDGEGIIDIGLLELQSTQ